MSSVLRWYDANKRAMPWRDCDDPYRILVSEFMLQQTRVATALPYFERWMLAFPTVADLAAADEQAVLAAWQGLGYYSRARNLRQTAILIAQHGWPTSRKEWLAMPGVGDYASAALASLTLGEPEPAVDGNVERVYARFAGDESLSLREPAREWARSILNPDRAGDSNQALMELGALVCTPRSPKCDECPLILDCRSRSEGTTESLPTRLPKRSLTVLDMPLAVFTMDGKYGVQPLDRNGWWKGMWGFPDLPEGCEGAEIARFNSTVTTHRIQTSAHLIELTTAEPGLSWKTGKELEAIPMPAPHRRVARSLG